MDLLLNVIKEVGLVCRDGDIVGIPRVSRVSRYAECMKAGIQLEHQVVGYEGRAGGTYGEAQDIAMLGLAA